METPDALAAALRAVGDIGAVVRTMKALSVASIRQFEQAEEAVGRYDATVETGLAALLRGGGALGEACGGPEGATALIVCGSERGLCGGFNRSVARFAAGRAGDRMAAVAVVGARAAARVSAEGLRVDRLFTPPGAADGLAAMVGSILVETERWTRERGVGRIAIIHNRRTGPSGVAPIERMLWPVPQEELRALADRAWPGRSLPWSRIPAETLLPVLLRERLFVRVYRSLAESLASEHASRLMAMEAAERNLEDRETDLRDAYRRRRQEAITRELLDIISGYEVAGSANSESGDLE